MTRQCPGVWFCFSGRLGNVSDRQSLTASERAIGNCHTEATPADEENVADFDLLRSAFISSRASLDTFKYDCCKVPKQALWLIRSNVATE